MNLYAYVGNDPLNVIDQTGMRRWGINFVVNVAAGPVGGKVRLDVSYDTTHGELSVKGTAGYKAGAQLGAKLEGYAEPSGDTPKGTSLAATGTIKVEAVGEVKTPVGSASASASAQGDLGVSTNNGVELGGDASADAGASWGPVSVDDNGRASVGIGGNVGVAAGAQVTGEITLSKQTCDANGACQ